MANTNSREEEQCHETFVTFFNAATEEQVTFFIEVSKRGNNEVWGIDVCFPLPLPRPSPQCDETFEKKCQISFRSKAVTEPVSKDGLAVITHSVGIGLASQRKFAIYFHFRSIGRGEKLISNFSPVLVAVKKISKINNFRRREREKKH